MFLIGHVTLSDSQNVTKGDKLTYDLKTGQATIDTNGGKAGRVHGQFAPNRPAPNQRSPNRSRACWVRVRRQMRSWRAPCRE